MKKIILIQLLILIAVCVFSQTLNRPVDFDISSDFGPRIHNGYDWQGGEKVVSGTLVSGFCWKESIL